MNRSDWLKSVGGAIRKWRERRGMSQVDLACAMGIGNVVQCRRERGFVDIPTWTLAEYAALLGVNPRRLLPDKPK